MAACPEQALLQPLEPRPSHAVEGRDTLLFAWVHATPLEGSVPTVLQGDGVIPCLHALGYEPLLASYQAGWLTGFYPHTVNVPPALVTGAGTFSVNGWVCSTTCCKAGRLPRSVM
ncbi:MAG: hypothetical protein R3E95_16350 [Thiolinea sp.]